MQFFQKTHMGGFQRFFRHPLEMSGEASLDILWPYLLVAFVHDLTSHIADYVCRYVGEVRITIPPCKLLGVLVICIYINGGRAKKICQACYDCARQWPWSRMCSVGEYEAAQYAGGVLGNY
jgi:hypothetical protein